MNEEPENENLPAEKMELSSEAVTPVAILPKLPKKISINEFRIKPLSEIYSMLEALPVKIPAKASKSQLVFELVAFYA